MSNLLAGRNTPVRVGSTVPAREDALQVGNKAVAIRFYDSGAISFGEKNVLSKANFHTFAQIRGFYSALATVMDSPVGVFASGFHLAKGWEFVLNAWDAPKGDYGKPMPIAYVNFGLLKDADILKRLTGMGIKPGKSGNNWLALSAQHGKLFPLYAIRFETRDAFVERVSKSIDGNPTEWKDLPYTFRNGYERNEATYHKHYGIEAVLRLQAGTLKVVVNPENVLTWQAPRLDKQFEMLFKSAEERREHYQAYVDNKRTQNQLRRNAYVLGNANEEEPVSVSDFVASADSNDLAEVYRNGEVLEIPFEDLFKKNVRFVFADGTTARSGKAYLRDKKEDVLAALQLAETFGAYVEVL